MRHLSDKAVTYSDYSNVTPYLNSYIVLLIRRKYQRNCVYISEIICYSVIAYSQYLALNDLFK